MRQRYSGFDEAGMGPLLGPLSIAHCSINAEEDADLKQLFSDAHIPVADSKKIHQSGNIKKLESVALSALEWLTGSVPQNAADVFALLQEQASDRDEEWMHGASELQLPLAATDIDTWQIPGCEPVGLSGSLLHPIAINDAYANGINKSTLELDSIIALIQAMPAFGGAHSIAVDRLGGRAYYAEALQALSDKPVSIIEEIKGTSAYHVQRGIEDLHISFLVKGEDRNPLIATASCIAKYARELHMHLFNDYWTGRMNWLKHTAGYPQDAKRWLFQLGEGLVNTHAKELVRGPIPDIFGAH